MHAKALAARMLSRSASPKPDAGLSSNASGRLDVDETISSPMPSQRWGAYTPKMLKA